MDDIFIVTLKCLRHGVYLVLQLAVFCLLLVCRAPSDADKVDTIPVAFLAILSIGNVVAKMRAVDTDRFAIF